MGRKSIEIGSQYVKIIGHKFGLLTVVECAGYVIKMGRKVISYKCLCDCGSYTTATSRDLKRSSVKSCGCLYRGKDLSGEVIGKLKVLSKVNNYEYKGREGYHYECLCECGNLVILTQNKLRNRVKSCGCSKSIPYNSPTESSARRLYTRHYSDGDLTFEQFLSISQMNCTYCGIEPNQKYSKHKGSKKFINRDNYHTIIENTTFVYNGLDRVDNNRGHDFDNCVACCKICNYAKRDMGLEEFRSWICRIYTHFGSK